MESKIFAIPKEIMTGSGNALFDHIAECLVEFVDDNELTDETLPLGFTFSFPCKQEGLAKVCKKYFYYICNLVVERVPNNRFRSYSGFQLPGSGPVPILARI